VIKPTHIFCDPDFMNDIQDLLPDLNIHPFSLDVNTVQDDITSLGIMADQTLWLIFAPAEPYEVNTQVKDHMNLCRENPLIGPNLGNGPRFPDMSQVYLDNDGVVAVLGEDKDLAKFDEPWISICGGIWEAIVLSQQGIRCKAWVVADLQKWVNELPAFD